MDDNRERTGADQSPAAKVEGHPLCPSRVSVPVAARQARARHAGPQMGVEQPSMDRNHRPKQDSVRHHRPVDSTMPEASANPLKSMNLASSC